jgi:hypothetical protein
MRITHRAYARRAGQLQQPWLALLQAADLFAELRGRLADQLELAGQLLAVLS